MCKKQRLLFHKPTEKGDIPLVLRKININNREIPRTESAKFLGVFLHENLSWKPHINYIKMKKVILVKIDQIVLYTIFFEKALWLPVRVGLNTCAIKVYILSQVWK